MEVALGVLPLLSAALYIWFRDHRPAEHSASPILAAAQSTSLSPDSRFNPHDGLRAFRRAYQAVQVSGEPFNIDLVHRALVRAVEATLIAVDTSQCILLYAQGRVTERWADFVPRRRPVGPRRGA